MGQAAVVRIVDWAFRDRRTGRIVVAQRPNPALVVWLIATAVSAVLAPEGAWRTALRVVAVGSLTWWAVDEVARGVNPWRRALGAAVLAGLVLSLVL
jgi:hypothetical protein